jgi:site-specific recombinase XerC
MRVREIARIKAGDFNWSKGTVTALGKGNKHQKAVSTEDTARMLREWFKE